MKLEKIKIRILKSLIKLYSDDKDLFTRNNNRGLCERCMVFRFAYYLQNEFEDYFVDCDFNSAKINNRDRDGKHIYDPKRNQPIKRYIDIIIHKRTKYIRDNYLCFEIKKWNNYLKKEFEKDMNNLTKLTTLYGYEYGFHIIFGKTKERTKISVIQNGKTIQDKINVFENETNTWVQPN